MATLFGGVYYAMSGPKKAGANAAPPINASSSDEADFIKCANSPGPSLGSN
jgi:F-type H+-transporting ATPase subunit k